jgi:hypothetical protein
LRAEGAEGVGPYPKGHPFGAFWLAVDTGGYDPLQWADDRVVAITLKALVLWEKVGWCRVEESNP